MKNKDIELVDNIELALFDLEMSINPVIFQKIKTHIQSIRKLLYNYKRSQLNKPKPIEKGKIIAMLYSKDVERLLSTGFTNTQIATITGIDIKEINDYIERKGLIK